MPSDALDIHLRRRFVEHAQARRPRLRKNLKQLGAVGRVTPPIPPGSQQAVVKVGVTGTSTTGKHLSYLQHGKGIQGQEATLFGPGAAHTRQFVQAAQHDPHQFRLVVSVPDHARLNRTQYIELFMAQVEQDCHRPLDWVAAHHHDTAHPHTHLVVRGRDLHGKDLYMEKHYVTYGLRARAAQLLTWLLGPAQNQQRQSMENDRQTHDGITRGNDDPDNRARQAFMGASQPAMTPTPQQQVPPRPSMETTQNTSQPALSLVARAEALIQRLEQQQEARQHAQEQAEQQARFQAPHRARQGGRQQGMGW